MKEKGERGVGGREIWERDSNWIQKMINLFVGKGGRECNNLSSNIFFSFFKKKKKILQPITKNTLFYILYLNSHLHALII